MEAQSPIEFVSFKGPYILEATFQTPRWQGLGEFRVIPIETASSRRSRVQKGGICHTQLDQCVGMWVAHFQGLSGTLSSYQCKYKRKAFPRGQTWSPRNGDFGNKKREKKPGHPLHGAVERLLDLGPGGLSCPLGSGFPIKVFDHLTPTSFASKNF